MSDGRTATASPGTAAAPDGGWERLAREAAAHRRGGAEEAQLAREFLVLRLAGTSYAVPVERVREIVRLRPITPVPRVPPSLVGVISLRGEVVEVVDLRRRLGLESPAPCRAARIVVVNGEDGRTSGLLVDGVSSVLRTTEEAMRHDAPGDPGSVAALCVREGELVSILDLERVLDLDDGR